MPSSSSTKPVAKSKDLLEPSASPADAVKSNNPASGVAAEIGAKRADLINRIMSHSGAVHHHSVSQFGKLESDVFAYKDEEVKLYTVWNDGCFVGNDHIFQKKAIRQCFRINPDGKRLLIRSEEERKVDFNSLFLDLVFVGAFSGCEHGLDHTIEHGGTYLTALLQFFLSFFVIHISWLDMVVYSNLYSPTDLIHKLYLLIQMLLVTFMVSTGLFMGEKGASAAIFVGITFVNFAFYWIARYQDPVGVSIGNEREFVFVACIPLFLVAIYGKDYTGFSENFSLSIMIAIFFFYSNMRSQLFTDGIKKRGKKAMEDKKVIRFIALNIEHFTERCQLFIMLLFGEVILGIQFDVDSAEKETFFAAGLVLLTSFSLQTIFFDVECGRSAGHPYRRGGLYVRFWTWAHMVMGGCILLLGSGSKEMLQHTHQSNVPEDIVWMYSGGLSMVILCLVFMSSLHKHHDDYRISKRTRNIMKLSLAIAIACFPLMKERFTPIGLMTLNSVLVTIMAIIDFHGDQKIIPTEKETYLLAGEDYNHHA